MVLGVSEQSTATLQTFIADQDITFPILQDLFSNQNNGASVYQLYLLTDGQSPFPRDFVIDKDGIILYASTEYEPAAMIAIFDELLPPFGNLEVEEELTLVPEKFGVSHYPNPFNSSTTIQVDLPHRSGIEIDIYNLAGIEVKSLHRGPLRSGIHRFQWRSRSNADQSLPSGIYFLRVAALEQVQTRKLILLK